MLGPFLNRMVALEQGVVKNKFELMRERLDKVSPSFCLAKWTQVTLHLHSGKNHSCHHPGVHSICSKEIKRNPSALHNTVFKKDQRRKMLQGERPPECNYCWNIEDLGKENVSDRVIKSLDNWSAPHFEEIANASPNADYNPQYVEVSFSSLCNFACSYCSANFSTRWRDDIKRNGNYSTLSGLATMDSIPEESNPYVEAFWKWWPDLVKTLKIFRITGGEPLLSQSTFRVLESINQDPQPHLEFAINSNLGVSHRIVEKFVEHLRPLVSGRKVKKAQVYTSLDAWGRQAEYIRYGLDLQLYKKNLEYILTELPGVQVGLMVTYNALSLTSFDEMLKYMLDLRRRFENPERVMSVVVDISYLNNPPYQNIQVLPPSYVKYAERHLQFMKENSDRQFSYGFCEYEITKMERVVQLMRKEISPGLHAELRERFYRFFTEHDQRRQTNFLESFPEMSEFWRECQGTNP